MKTMKSDQSMFCLFLAMASIFFNGAESATFTLKNNCAFTIWPGMLTGSGPPLSVTGFTLLAGASNSIDVQPTWSGRIWPRTRCTTDATGKLTCATGDCGSGQPSCNGAGGTPPATLAEFTLAANNGQDFYDISLVDGFNVPLSIAPQGGSGGCATVSCVTDVNVVCPLELQVKASDGSVVACNSACLALNQPQYCCTGAFGSPQTCPPTNYSMLFKNQCPQAYSYAYDDKSGLASCVGGPNYTITFCP